MDQFCYLRLFLTIFSLKLFPVVCCNGWKWIETWKSWASLFKFWKTHLKSYFVWCSLVKFVWYLLHNSAVAFGVWVEAHYTFLGNCPPTPLLSQHFTLSDPNLQWSQMTWVRNWSKTAVSSWRHVPFKPHFALIFLILDCSMASKNQPVIRTV